MGHSITAGGVEGRLNLGRAGTTFQEWQADTDPTNAHSCFCITSIAQGPPVSVQFLSSSNRVYTLFSSPAVTSGGGATGVWTPIPGQAAVPGSGGLHTLSDTNPAPAAFYRVGVRAP